MSEGAWPVAALPTGAGLGLGLEARDVIIAGLIGALVGFLGWRSWRNRAS